jgi:hypothetical protein
MPPFGRAGFDLGVSLQGQRDTFWIERAIRRKSRIGLKALPSDQRQVRTFFGPEAKNFLF